MSDNTFTFTDFYSRPQPEKIDFTLMLTAEERMRSHQRLELENNLIIHLKLPRNKTLTEGDILTTKKQDFFLEITAKPELLLTVTASNQQQLMRGAYHLGNRHIPVEIKPDYLRLSPDPVLTKMLMRLGLDVKAEICPFYPEKGAYHHH